MNEQTTFNFFHATKTTSSQKDVIARLRTSLPFSAHQPPLARPIHYLGSKLRIVHLVRDAVDSVDPSGGPVCDLFAGSGTVSRELSKSRTVIAVDIQEYSRVLCSALLKPARLSNEILDHFMHTVESSDHARRLSWAIEPMVAYETSCRRRAEDGEIEPLCELLQNGSIISFQQCHCRSKGSSLIVSLRKTISRLQKVRLSDTPSTLTARYFGGIYFSYLQASAIDILLEAIASLPPTKRDTFLAAVLSTASDAVNTVGKQFAQPIRPCFADGRPKPDLAERIARDRDMDVFEVFGTWIARYLALPQSEREHRVVKNDYEQALKKLDGQVSVVYADPPYTRDHYSRFYHVLETLCLRDCPPVSKVRLNGEDRISRGMYRTERYQSPFCIMSQAPNAFSTLFAKVRRLHVPLVLSYSPYKKETGARPRLMELEDITKLARKSFRLVEALPAGRVAHSKLNRSDMNKVVSYGAEYFLICEP